MYIWLVKIYTSLFSAMELANLAKQTSVFHGNKDKLFDWQYLFSSATEKKRKENMEITVWKYTLERMVHGTWKE